MRERGLPTHRLLTSKTFSTSQYGHVAREAECILQNCKRLVSTVCRYLILLYHVGDAFVPTPPTPSSNNPFMLEGFLPRDLTGLRVRVHGLI
jgi:hypothetical protein